MRSVREKKRRKRGRVSSAHRPSSHGGPVSTRRSSNQESKEKETKRDQSMEEDETEDMLSHVYSDSEDTMRATLLSGVIHTTCTILRPAGNGAVCMVEDGVYSPPSETHGTIFVPSQPRHAVY